MDGTDELRSEASVLEAKSMSAAGNSGRLDGLDEILLCQVCKRQFKDARFLPCHHYFCRSCIEGLITSSDTNIVLCPQCHIELNLPENGTAALPVAFVVERIRERIRSRSNTLWEEHVCQDHGIPLKLYCLECGQLLCPECALHRHGDHPYDYVTSVAPMYMESVKQQFDTLIKIKESSESQVRKIESSKRDLLESSSNVTDTVNQCFDEMVRHIEARRKAILDELTSIVQQQVELYQKEETLLVSTISHIEELKYKWDSVHAPSSGSKGAIVLLAELVPQLKEKAGKMLPPTLDSCETIIIVPEMKYVSKMKALCECIKVDFIRQADPSTAAHAPVQNLPATVELGKRLSFSIPTCGKNCDNADIRASVSALADNSCTPLCVSRDMNIIFTPVVRGRHKLAVEVNGEHVPGSPFPLFVTVPIEQLQNPVRVVDGLKAPYALAFNSAGNMVVAHSHPQSRLSVYCKQGQKVLEVKPRGLCNPSGVAVDDQDDVYVSESKNHCVMKFRGGDWAHLKTIGRYGSGHGEFSSPQGLKVIEGQLYVCDVGNCRVQIFNKQLEFIKLFKVGSGVTDIACSVQKGCFYLSGKNIEVLDRNHAYLFAIYDMNSISVCFNERQNTLCLADCHRNCLCVMNLDSDKVVNRFLSTEVGRNRPYGMAIDEDGYIYVCDTTNGRILVY